MSDVSAGDNGKTEMADAVRSVAADEVAALMPVLRIDLERLVRIPSIAFPGFPPEPLVQAHDLVVDLLRDAGAEHLETLSLPDTAPVITGEIPGPPRVLRRSCCTATTTSYPRESNPTGARRRSSPTSAMALSTGAGPRTPRPTSSRTSAHCVRGGGGHRWGSSS